MNQYSNRRERINNLINNDFAALIFSGKSIARSADDSYPFSVDRNFYYLTGIDAEGMALLMTKINGVYSEKIFILPYDELLAKWVGGRMKEDEVSSISEIKNVENIADLDDAVARIINYTRENENFSFYFDMWHYSIDQDNSEATKYANKLRNAYPYLNIKDLFNVLTSMRLVKDEHEINSLRQAIQITNVGILQMMKTSKPGLNESVMEGVFDFVLKQAQVKENAFQTIAAAGKNATILHYHSNDQIMNDDELFLCDLGATCNHYCADISRTFPVNGQFTDRQKEIYEIVLNAQRIVEENAKPGVKLRDLNQMVVDYYKEELPKHGLMKGVSEYYFHSISHHIGLDTHDVSGNLGSILQVGNVISNEPGLYIEDENIGIRIEDDLYISENGAINLSSQIIKTVEEIESFMRPDIALAKQVQAQQVEMVKAQEEKDRQEELNNQTQDNTVE